MTRSTTREWLRGAIVLAISASIGSLGCTTSRTPVGPEDAGGLDAPFVIEIDAQIDAYMPPDCPPGEVDCGGGCTRLAADSLHCGECGNACPAGSTCAVGRCDCYAPMLACDGLCTDPMADAENCGTCGNACGPTEMCSAGECIVSCTEADHAVCVTRDESGAPTQVCADLLNDSSHCGACNTRCAAGSTCQAGRCACPGGQLSCGGACTDITTDPENCGGCLNSCGEGGVCAGSRCTTCGTGLTACGTAGRCVDTSTSRLHCGTCGRACGAGEACAGGLCQCVPGLIDCGTGCTDPMTDERACGGCGIDCGPGGVCNAGVCECSTGLTECAGSCVDTDTALAHCGGCDMPCPPLVGGVCAGGTCGCPSGLTDCGGSCRNTTNDREHCGMCGMACPAGEVCLMGGCTDAPPTRYEQIVPPAGTVTWIEACTAPGVTVLLPTRDDGSARTTLPFPFRYWATDLAAGAPVNVTTNGWMSLDTGTLASLSGTVPSTSTPNAVIAPHWGDNYTRAAGICVATVGTAPNRQLVVQWEDTHYCCTAGTTHLTYEVILTEGTNTIDFVYRTMDGARSQTMGIENQTGTMGINACPGGTGGCIPTAGQIIRFNPIP